MLNIIIIDDEANSREVLELMINEQHPDVKILASASNIKDGLSLIAKHQPDVVFLDIEMPGGNGFELVKNSNRPFLKLSSARLTAIMPSRPLNAVHWVT